MKPYDFDREFNRGMSVVKFFFGFVFLMILVVFGAQAYAVYYGVKAVGRGDGVCIDDHCIHYKPVGSGR